LSSLLALQTKESIVLASDTALSVTYNKQTFRVSNDESKIFEFDDFVMFASGKKHLRDNFIYKLSKNSSIHDIQLLLETDIKKHCNNDFGLEIVIAMKDMSKLIFLSSVDGFIYSENICTDNNTHLFTAGYKTVEIGELFTSIFEKKPLLQSIEETYKRVSCSEIGGSIDIFYLTREGLTIKKINIDNNFVYESADIENYILNLVHAEKLAGKLILGNKLMIESDLGLFTIDGATQTIYDANKVKKVEIGRYKNPSNLSEYKYGVNIMDGQFDIRTSSNANRGIQLDSNGVRAFNSNNVRTFNVDAATGQVEIIGDLTIKSSPSSYRGVVITSSGITGYNSSGGITFELNANSGRMTSQENFLIQTSTSPNRGVKMDDYGIRGYNTSGTKTFEIDIYGNATFSGTITASTIYGTTINGTTINGGTINGVQINSANIDITESVKIGAGLVMQSDNCYITFGTNSGNIAAHPGGLMLASPSGKLELMSANVSIGSQYGGTIDFNHMTGINAENIKVGSATYATNAQTAQTAQQAQNAVQASSSFFANSCTTASFLRGLWIAYNSTFVYIRDEEGNNVAQLKRSDA